MKRIAPALFILILISVGCRPKTPRPNLLLISIDTLRADRLGVYGCRQARTPNIDRAARNGFFFTDVTSPAPLTTPAHASLLTGLYPPSHGVRDNGAFRLSAEKTTLAELLEREGYSTGAIVASFVLKRRFGLDQGFAEYDDRLAEGLGRAREIDAARVTEKALAWLKGRKEPFFLWAHYFDPHADYEPPEPFRSDFSDSPYDGEVAYVDREIGKLFDFLEREGLQDRTIIVITSDHGEGLGEHGEPTHGLMVYQSTLQVPLIFSGKDVPVGRSERPVSLIDVFPTILGRLGLPLPEEIQGRDLSPLFAGGTPPPEVLYFETLAPRYNLNWSGLKGVRGDRYKYIKAPRPEIYDLEEDPGEVDNLFGRDPDLVAELSRRLKGWGERFAEGEDRDGERRGLSAEEEEVLFALGYGGGRFLEDKALGKDPKEMAEVMELISRSESQLRRNDLAGVEATMWEILSKDACNPMAWERLFYMCLTRGETEKALAAAEGAISCNPAESQPYKLKAEVLRRQGDLKGAEEFIRRALEIDGSRTELWVGLGKILRERGRLPEAFRSFREALARDPNFVPAHCNLADYYFRVEDWREAEEALLRAIELEPANPDLRSNLGIYYLERGDPDRAREEFEEVLRSDPSHQLSREKLAGLEETGGRNFKDKMEAEVIE